MKNKAVFLSIILATSLAIMGCSARGGEDTDSAGISDQISQNESASTENSVAESPDQGSSENEIPEEEKQAYQKAIGDFKEITMDELKKLEKDKKEAFIYSGALYCPYCRNFAPILDELAKKKNIEVYYLDAEKAGTDFDAYAADKNVEYIPAIFYLKDGKSKGYDTYFFNVPFSKSDISNKIDEIVKTK